MLLALAVTTPPAHAYTIETAFGGQFSIATASHPRDHEEYRETYIDPAFIDEGFFADAYAGSGVAIAESELHYSTTSTTIAGHGAIAGSMTMGDVQNVASQTESYLVVRFRVTEPTLFQFDSELTLNLSPKNFEPSTLVARLQQMNHSEGASGFHGPSGLLTPGVYQVSCHLKMLYALHPQHGVPLVDSNASFCYLLTLTRLPVGTEASTWGRIKALYR